MTLAHKTFKEVHDRVCDLLGLLSAEDADFDADNLDRPQIKLKRFISLFNQMTMRTMHKQFSTLVLSFNTQAGVDTYELDEKTRIEAISYHTVYNKTSGLQMQFMTLKELREMYPQGEPTTQAAPIYWIPMLGTIEDGQEIPNRMKLSPVPDGIYTIEYQAKLNTVEMLNHDDKILLPPDWDDLLIMGAYNMFNLDIKEADWTGYVQQQLAQIHAVAAGPVERKISASFGGLRLQGIKERESGGTSLTGWNYW